MQINTDYIISDSDGSIIITTTNHKSDIDWLEKAKRVDSINNRYSTYLKDMGGTSPIIDRDWIDRNAENPQSDLKKITEINQVINILANKNWIVGCYIDVITKNVNTRFRLSYNEIDEKNSGDLKSLNECKSIINNFNNKINLENLIKTSIPTVVREGNFCFYVRNDLKTNNHCYTFYPLNAVEVSDYDINGQPQLLMNIANLKKRLEKVYKKTKKNKALFFKAIDDEIKNNYPEEVYKAFKNKEEYAVLNSDCTGFMRVNNQNKKYGLSPIFRALESIRMLEQFDNADEVNAKAKAKKIILQLLRKEIMGMDYKNDSYAEMQFAHENFMNAFRQNTVVVTAPAWVEDIKYIEPTVDNTNKETVENYTLRALSTLGINFLMGTTSTGASIATIALDQLMKTINSISEQLEHILEKNYRYLLKQYGYDEIFAPKIKIIDSELMEQSIKQDLAKLLYTTFNVSFETCLDILGIDINDEKMKRKNENVENLGEVFSPRATSYNSNGNISNNKDVESGRPANTDVENVEKRNYDKGYNSKVRV